MSKRTHSPTLNSAKLERIKEARKILETNQLDWSEHASATHFILHLTCQPEEDIGFWPTTGKFYSRSENYKGRGLNSLIEFINEHYPIIGE